MRKVKVKKLRKAFISRFGSGRPKRDWRAYKRAMTDKEIVDRVEKQIALAMASNAV